MIVVKFEYTIKSHHKLIIRKIEAEPELLFDRKKLSDKALSYLSVEQREDLLKIECDVFKDDEAYLDVPEWFKEAEGHLYFQEGELID